MAALEELPHPLGDIHERRLAEQEAVLAGLRQRDGLNSRQLELAAIKLNLTQSQASLQQRCRQREGDRKELALGRQAAQLGVDLAKSRVDLHRWRQRTALLKVRLSSAHEDVERYRRVGELLQRQLHLELGTQHGLRGQVADLAQQVLLLATCMREQAATIAKLQVELLKGAEEVAERDRNLAAQQEAMLASSEQAQAALAESQAVCTRLQDQVATVNERARLAEQTAAAAQERAKLAEETLRQKEALMSEQQRFQSEVQHFSQDLQKLARETTSAVDGKLQEQLAAAQAQLFEEQRRRLNAEGEVEMQRTKAAQVHLEVDRLQRSLAARDSLIQQLKSARSTDTPARQVTQTMELVGSLAADLAATPATEPHARKQSKAAAPEGQLPGKPGMLLPKAAEHMRGKKQENAALASKEANAKKPSRLEKAGARAAKAAAQEQPPASDGRPAKKKKSGGPAPAKADPPMQQDAAAAGPASPTDSRSSWGDEDSVDDPSFPVEGARGAGKSKQPRADAAVDAEARPQRKRKQAGAFWMGGSDQEAAQGQHARDDQQQEQQPIVGSSNDRVDGGKESSKNRSNRAATEQHPDAPQARKPTKGKPSKEQRNGGTKVGSKQQRAMDKENGAALNVLSAAAAECEQQQAEDRAVAELVAAVPTSRLEQRPLGALSSRVLEAAAQRQDLGNMPITAQLQKVIAARTTETSRGENASQPQPGKRKLLSISTTFTLPGDAVPAQRSLGAAKLPRHTHSNQL